MLRRGLTSDEINRMPLDEFYELWFFETHIEPQGPIMQDYQQAHLAYSAFVNNPNLKQDSAKKYKIDDFRLIKDKVFLSEAEKEEKRIKDEEANKAKIESLFEPDLLEKARARSEKAKKVKNGKQ